VEGLDNLPVQGQQSQIYQVPPPSKWVRKYSIVALVIDILTYAYVIWLSDFYGGSEFSEIQTVLDTIPFVLLITLPLYALSGRNGNPMWLFIILAPELITMFLFASFNWWGFPYGIPFLIQLPLLVYVRNRYFGKPRKSYGYGRSTQE
jgi:hypothetical protein